MMRRALQDESDMSSMEALFSQLTIAPPGQEFDLHGVVLHLNSDWKAASDPRVDLLGQQSGSSILLHAVVAKVSNVTLCLGDTGRLILHGSSKIEFSNVRIQGKSRFWLLTMSCAMKSQHPKNWSHACACADHLPCHKLCVERDCTLFLLEPGCSFTPSYVQS